MEFGVDLFFGFAPLVLAETFLRELGVIPKADLFHVVDRARFLVHRSARRERED